MASPEGTARAKKAWDTRRKKAAADQRRATVLAHRESAPHMYEVRGPHRVPVARAAGHREIAPKLTLKPWWKNFGSMAKKHGCYVIAMRYRGKITPVYVGMTAKRKLMNECFDKHQRDYCNEVLAKDSRTPVVLLIAATDKWGRKATGKAEILRIERWLINAALDVNPHLKNLKGFHTYQWGIKGVIRGGKRKLSGPAKDLRKALGIKA